MQAHIKNTNEWQEIKVWLDNYKEQCIQLIVKPTQTQDNTNFIRGRLKMIEQLVNWIEVDNSTNRGVNDGEDQVE